MRRVRLHLATMVQAALVVQRRYRAHFYKRIRFLLKIQRAAHRMRLWRMLMRIKRFGFFWKYRRHQRARQVDACFSLCVCSFMYQMPFGVSAALVLHVLSIFIIVKVLRRILVVRMSTCR